MTTKLDIVNLALARIGSRDFVDAFTEDTTEAEVANAIYNPTLDMVLARFPWPFATKRATLAPLNVIARDGWSYTFAAPADMLAPRYIWAGTNTPTASRRIAFAVELNDAGTGSVLVCNEQAPRLVYTARVLAENIYSPLFIQALAWALAVEFAAAIPVKPELAMGIINRFEMTLLQAASSAFTEGWEGELPESELVTSRY